MTREELEDLFGRNVDNFLGSLKRGAGMGARALAHAGTDTVDLFTGFQGAPGGTEYMDERGLMPESVNPDVEMLMQVLAGGAAPGAVKGAAKAAGSLAKKGPKGGIVEANMGAVPSKHINKAFGVPDNVNLRMEYRPDMPAEVVKQADGSLVVYGPTPQDAAAAMRKFQGQRTPPTPATRPQSRSNLPESASVQQARMEQFQSALARQNAAQDLARGRTPMDVPTASRQLPPETEAVQQQRMQDMLMQLANEQAAAKLAR